MSRRGEIICAWMREKSKDEMLGIAKSMTERYRGRLEEHEVVELHDLLCEAFVEGYFSGRADEDTDGYWFSMYQDLRRNGCL